MKSCLGFSQWALLCLAGLLSCNELPRAHAGYAEDFTLTNHVTGEPMRFSDLAGSVVVLEFFSPRCTSCRTAAPDIRTNIVDYFRAAGGNADGLPVQVLSINEWTNNADTDPFIQTNGLELVLDDTVDHSVFKQFGGIVTPHFVVVNAVTNGVNYPAWQVLGTLFGYTAGSTVTLLRGYINAVRGTVPPLLHGFGWGTNGSFQARFVAQRGRTNWVEATTNWVDWLPLGAVSSNTAVQFFDPDADRLPQRFYRIRVE